MCRHFSYFREVLGSCGKGPFLVWGFGMEGGVRRGSEEVSGKGLCLVRVVLCLSCLSALFRPRLHTFIAR